MSSFGSPTKRRRIDDVATWPQNPHCLRCVKDLMINPRAECIMGRSVNCGACNKQNASCQKIPIDLHELVRSIEDLAADFVHWLDTHDQGSGDNWNFEDFKTTHGLKNSGNVLKPEVLADTHIPEQFRNLYVEVQSFIRDLKLHAGSASVAGVIVNEQNDLMRELIGEIRGLRLAYMAQQNLNAYDDGGARAVPKDILRHFTKG